MKMDKNTMFMIGAGVLGFVAVRYFMKSKNSSSETKSEYIGTGSGSKCTINVGGVHHSFNCGETVNIPYGSGSEWNGYTANCTSQGSFGCTVSNGQQSYSGTKTRTRATKKMRSYSSACGCGA